MKLLIQIILLVIIFQVNAHSGESGDLPEQETNKNLEKVFGETNKEKETFDISSVSELLSPKDNKVTLPTNRLTQIFNQYLLNELNTSKTKIIGECQKSLSEGKCFKVNPSKKSKHFNNYYFYTNKQNLVFSIIAFDDKKQADLNKCKRKIDMWKEFFTNYDLKPKNLESNSLSFILSDAPQQNKIEVFTSCYTENYRDIKSSFSLKIYKNS